MESESNTVEESTLRHYLLGEVADGDLERLEERLFSDERLWEQLCLVEDDLIDSYVRGELRGAERAHFESHFLSSPRRRERVAIARAWFAPKQAAGAPAEPRWIAALRPLFGGGVAWRLAPAAAVLVVLAGGAALIGFRVQLANQRNETALLRRQFQELAGRQSVPAAGPDPGLVEQLKADLTREARALVAQASRTAAPVATLLLTPGAQRGIGQAGQRIAIPPGDQPVQLILTLDDPGAYTSYRGVIQTAGGVEVWGIDQLSVSKGPGGASLRLMPPSRVLRQGDYTLLLWGLSAGRPAEELDEYYVFHVVAARDAR